MHIWDLDTGREQAAWTGHDGTITGLAISADGRRIVTGSDDATVILWDADRRDPAPVRHAAQRPGRAVAFDPEGHIVAAGNGVGGPPAAAPGTCSCGMPTPMPFCAATRRPFARHLAVAALPGGRVLTTDDYAVSLWTPRPTGPSRASRPPARTEQDRGRPARASATSPTKSSVTGR